MLDVLLIAVVLAFFAAATLYVRACAWIAAGSEDER